MENFETGEVLAVGGPGMLVFTTAMAQGDITPVLERPEAFELVIQVDLPFYLPIPDQPFRVAIRDRTVQVLHKSKRPSSRCPCQGTIGIRSSVDILRSSSR